MDSRRVLMFKWVRNPNASRSILYLPSQVLYIRTGLIYANSYQLVFIVSIGKNIALRRDRLLKWLRANHVDVDECDDGSLLIFSAARIESPFTEESCFCDNAIILKRLRGLVSKVPK
uniref:Gemin6_C domain-containing protein n=1 Tax=Angiostrongylus cantonensis TaxID=6313 RepID=A0A0K0CX25_ANGCA